MKYQSIFSRIIGIALSLMLLGLLSLTAYAAEPVPGDAAQALPAANHCAGLSSDAAGSSLLAANPELATVCRYASMALEQQGTVDTPLPNMVEPAANHCAGLSGDAAGSSLLAANPELATVCRYASPALEQADLERDARLADNPELIKAGRYPVAESGASLQKVNPIQRFGLAEYLAAKEDTALAQK